MTQPVLTHYWIKVFADGDTALPQFGPETGKQNQWGIQQDSLSKILLAPFSVELAQKVAQYGTAALATSDPVLEFIVRPSDTNLEAGITGDIHQYEYFQCDICGEKWRHVKTAEHPYAQCPNCKATDDWHCSRCDAFKYYPFRIGKRGEVQCPDCDIPVGLDRVRKLFPMVDIKHTCDYFVKCDRCKVTLKDSGDILVE